MDTEGWATLRLVAASVPGAVAVGFNPQFSCDEQLIK